MKTLVTVCTSIIISMVPAYSMATLGEAVNSSSKTVAATKIQQKATEDKFTIHEYEERGNTVREYATLSGVVFAVGWKGVSKPDLESLFGSYYSEYKGATESQPKNYGMKSVSLKTSRLQISRVGRMRDQRGFAYIPSLVPDGVNIVELQQ